jgi:hypothetical protein
LLIGEGDEIKCRSPNFVSLRKTEFSGLGIAEGQNRFEQLLGTFYTDFNTGKLNGVTKRKFGEKK